MIVAAAQRGLRLGCACACRELAEFIFFIYLFSALKNDGSRGGGLSSVCLPEVGEMPK